MVQSLATIALSTGSGMLDLSFHDPADQAMFVLFGEQSRNQEVASGDFDCPVCLGRQHYHHRRIKQYFSLFFIPLLPLEDSANYLICSGCQACFDPQILKQPQEYCQACNHQALRRALCYLVAGYGDTTRSREQMRTLYQDATGQPLDDAAIDDELQLIHSGLSATLPYLHQLAPRLSAHAKQQLVLASYQLARRLGEMDFDDRVRINTLAAELGLSLPEVNYLISSVE